MLTISQVSKIIQARPPAKKVGITLTKQPQQMLPTIDIRKSLARQVARRILNPLMDIIKLIPLKSIEQNPAQTAVKILLEAGNDLFKNIGFCAARPPFRLLGLEVLVQDNAGGFGGGQMDQLQVFGDVFPVINHEGFEAVRHVDFDGAPGLERLFLLGRIRDSLIFRKRKERRNRKFQWLKRSEHLQK